MRRTLFLFWSWIRGSALFHPVRFLRDFRRFFLDWSKFNAENGRKSFHVGWRNLYPCWEDWNASACTLSYYFWQDLWAARKIFMARPPVHFDIASRVDGFIAHLLCFMPVTMLDIRPLRPPPEASSMSVFHPFSCRPRNDAKPSKLFHKTIRWPCESIG